MKRRETIISSVKESKSTATPDQRENPFESPITKLSNQGIDLSQPIDASTFKAIEAAFFFPENR